VGSSERGRALGVSVTPTFCVNGRRIEGLNFDQFLAVIFSENSN
jgi:protein-disulfide isomerase